jgi:hypothetical protein
MVSAILLYTSLNFCTELNKARALEDEQKVEQILKARLEQVKPKDPWLFFQRELKECGINMPDKDSTTGISKGESNSHRPKS